MLLSFCRLLVLDSSIKYVSLTEIVHRIYMFHIAIQVLVFGSSFLNVINREEVLGCLRNFLCFYFHFSTFAYPRRSFGSINLLATSIFTSSFLSSSVLKWWLYHFERVIVCSDSILRPALRLRYKPSDSETG